MREILQIPIVRVLPNTSVLIKAGLSGPRFLCDNVFEPRSAASNVQN
jgi:hypothetical protein